MYGDFVKEMPQFATHVNILYILHIIVAYTTLNPIIGVDAVRHHPYGQSGTKQGIFYYTVAKLEPI